MNPLGGWATQEEDPKVLFEAFGPEVVKRKAAEVGRCRLTPG